MKQLEEARDALRAKKDEEARFEAARIVREDEAAEKVHTWLDELTRVSKVKVTLRREQRCYWVMYVDRTANIVSVHALKKGGVAYKYQDGHNAGTRDMTIEEIQRILCARVAQAEWDEVEAIAAKLTATPVQP